MKSWNSVKRNALLLVAILLNTILCAQSPDNGSDVILKAMQDELNRNMKELTLPNCEKPFFMMYGMLDVKSTVISATLGSLQLSSESSNRSKIQTRVIVGDYSFNDESLEANQSNSPGGIEIDLPLDNDYYGIRRAFWSTTDKVYRNAAKNFEKNKLALKETGKPLADIPHRWFAASEPVQVVSTLPPDDFDKSRAEMLAKNLSARFIKNPVITSSNVIIQHAEGYKYIVTSEGSVAKVPVRQLTYVVYAISKSKEGEFGREDIVHHAKMSNQLPSELQLSEEIDSMIAYLEKQPGMPRLKEEYTGPVMFAGKAVADLFSRALLRGTESIYASDKIAKLKGYDRNFNSLESKIGKSVLHESITVNVKSKLKSYNRIDLLGSFDIDDECIVPADELVVVDKGILKNLLNNRTLTSLTQKSNGFASGPGVIEVMIAQKNSDKVLKEKLIAEAKKQGLDFAILVREIPSVGSSMNVYKVSVTDGKEEPIPNAIISNVNLKSLKKVIGASEKSQAYNIGSTGGRPGAGLISLIVPESIIVEELDIRPSMMSSLKEEEYVSNPLEKK